MVIAVLTLLLAFITYCAWQAQQNGSNPWKGE